MPADDEEASGPPPHPLDRVWFHPSELGSTVTAIRPPPAPRVWLAAVVALLVGIVGTLAVVSGVGILTDATTGANRLERAVTPQLADPDAVATLVAGVGRSIVTITVTPAAGGDTAWAGSGVAVAPGKVLTAAHLLTGAGAVSIITLGGQPVVAKVAGIDTQTDLALLKIDGDALAPARLGTGDGLRIGQSVAALAVGPTPHRWVSAGVISGMNRVAGLAGGVQGVALLETDARMVSTAAGGALLDSTGAVIGILTGPDNLAVPIDIARDVATQLADTGQAAHGWLGVLTADVIDRPGGGVRVKAIVPGSPAEAAGLQPDDVVLSVGDVAVGNSGDLVAAFRRLKPGDPVDLSLIRLGKRIPVHAALGTSVAAPADWLIVA